MQFFRNLKFIVILILIIIFTALLVILIRNPFAQPEKDTVIDLSRPSVIKEIQSLGNLETASYSIEKIVEAGQQGNAFEDLLYGDRILLIAHGKVTAGVNLTAVTEDNISISGNTLLVTIPPPIILSSTLDNSQTRVYDRKQGFLSRGNKDLESEARLAAETSIRQGACDAGILEEARENAIKQIEKLFTFAGFSQVSVDIPAGSCI